jgi:hypothetical protein
MTEKMPWHQPKFGLLDARATAAAPDPGSGADAKAFDPGNQNGDLGPGGETNTFSGAPHPQFDPS